MPQIDPSITVQKNTAIAPGMSLVYWGREDSRLLNAVQQESPLIYTYFKDSPINLSKITSGIRTLLDFQDKLTDLGHFYTTYKEISDLKYLFEQQLNKYIIPKLTDKIEVASQQEKTVSIWPNRDKVRPTFRDRIEQATQSIFFVGLSLATTLRDFQQPLLEALQSREIKVRLLFLDPDSPHVDAHQPFAGRKIKSEMEQVITQRLWSMWERLTEAEQVRLSVKVTPYLPRFAARIFDGDQMLLNLYLFQSAAQSNPVIELKRSANEREFKAVEKSLEELWEYKGNRDLVMKGEWHDL